MNELIIRKYIREIKIAITKLFCFALIALFCSSLIVINSEAITPSSELTASDHGIPSAKTIEQLLKEQFKVVEPEASPNPFPILVPRADKTRELNDTNSKYAVLSVDPFFDEKSFFQHQKILLVTISTIVLEARIKTGNRSIGIFALKDKKLTYLNGSSSIANVTKILKREHRSLSEADPQMLANFFAMTILRQGNDRIDVVQSSDDILKLDKPNAAKMNEILKTKNRGRLYATTVDKAELEKCKSQFIKPKLLSNTKSGWICHFIGLQGFMHTIRTPFALVEYSIYLSPTFNIKIVENVLSPKIII